MSSEIDIQYISIYVVVSPFVHSQIFQFLLARHDCSVIVNCSKYNSCGVDGNFKGREGTNYSVNFTLYTYTHMHDAHS